MGCVQLAEKSTLGVRLQPRPTAGFCPAAPTIPLGSYSLLKETTSALQKEEGGTLAQAADVRKGRLQSLSKRAAACKVWRGTDVSEA
jgi:hypothetical protein